jgi:DNA polymerase-3 subunit epsilon
MPNHQLHTLAAHYGIPLNHHEATSDAAACAELAIRLFRVATPAALDGLVQRFA